MVTTRYKLNKFITLMKTMVKNRDEFANKVSTRNADLENLLQVSDDREDEAEHQPHLKSEKDDQRHTATGKRGSRPSCLHKGYRFLLLESQTQLIRRNRLSRRPSSCSTSFSLAVGTISAKLTMLGVARKEIEELEIELRQLDSKLVNKKTKCAAITKEIKEVMIAQDQVGSNNFL